MARQKKQAGKTDVRNEYWTAGKDLKNGFATERNDNLTYIYGSMREANEYNIAKSTGRHTWNLLRHIPTRTFPSHRNV